MDGIERRVDDQAQILRLRVTDSVGRKLALRYGVRRVPSLVLLDGSGNVVLKQSGMPKPEEIIAAVGQMTK